MSQSKLGRSLAFAGALVTPASLVAIGACAQPFATPPETVNVPAYPASGTTTPAQPVSLRSGPNTGFPVIGTLRPGMPLQILASANYGWTQVQSPVGTGWVYGSYLASGTGGAMPASSEPMPNGNVEAPAASTQPAPVRRNPAAPEITSP
jgi:Bacterial SH3 domain